jgi:hypothetical protein
MPLLETEIFEHEFKSKITMIQGLNGSGKSASFDELSPLPADKAFFYKDGYKEIHIQHDGKLFKLISDFTNGSHFSFLMDDVEQNHANNVSTQRELAFLYFNINQSIHDILIGKESLTTMSLIARKKLFSAITHLNIDKVLDNYNTLKEELRNNEVILKSQTSLYQAEESKLTNTNHIQTLQETLTRTKTHIDFLIGLRTELHQYKTTVNIDERCQQLKTLQTKLQDTINKYYTHITAFPKEHVSEYTLKYTSQLNLITYQLDQVYTTIERKQQELNLLNITKASDFNTLNDKLTNIEEMKQRLTSSLFFFKNTESDPQAIRSDLYKLESVLPEILRTIPTNTEKRLTKVRYEELLSIKKNLLDEFTTVATQELTLTKEQQELNATSDDVSCPKCAHTWSIKDIPSLLIKNKTALSKVLQRKIDLQTQLKTTDTEIEQIRQYFVLYDQYTSLRNTTQHHLKPIWNLIDEQVLILKDPVKILTYLDDATIEVNTLEKIQSLVQEKNELTKKINLFTEFKDVSLTSLTSEINELFLTSQELQATKVSLLSTLDTIAKVTTLYTFIDRLRTHLEASVSDLHTTNVSYTISDILNVLESDLSKYKIVLIETEKELHKYETIQYTLQKHKKTIDDTQLNIKVLKIILDELSPKNGLIAKSISSFLNMIIVNVNKSINSVWNYKMELKPINIESDNLDYRFKVEVEDKLTINDAGNCSRGMKEIIDLSFKLVVYKLLGMEQYPLWLDELGSHIDKHHMDKLIYFIQQIAMSDKYSQIFIISHKDNLHYLRDLEVVNLS